ncbi:MAG: c-type cytochrome [Desulfobulbaceae bacterium]|nr:c-type cytochrome [Desulfobulbaceae bacterium]
MTLLRVATTLCLIFSLMGCSGNKNQEKPEGLRLLEFNGCLACHSLDGTTNIGPSLKGVFRSEVVVISNDEKKTITADREYMKRAILHPEADIVEGFQAGMPTNFMTQLGEKNTNTILDYLESIGKK